MLRHTLSKRSPLRRRPNVISSSPLMRLPPAVPVTSQTGSGGTSAQRLTRITNPPPVACPPLPPHSAVAMCIRTLHSVSPLASSSASSPSAYSFAIRHPLVQGSWQQALLTLYKLCRSTQGRPSVIEQLDMLNLMPHSWSRCLMFYTVLKETARVRVSQRLVTSMISAARRCGNLHLARHVMKTDLMSVMEQKTELTNDTIKTLFSLLVSTSDWEGAIAMMKDRDGYLQRIPHCVSMLLDCVGHNHSIAMANAVRLALREIRGEKIRLHHNVSKNVADLRSSSADGSVWSNPSLVTFANTTMLRLLQITRGTKTLTQAQELVAECLATGAPLSLSLFLPVAEMMNRRSMWKEALDTLLSEFQLLEHGLQRFSPSVTQVVINSLHHVNPYHNISAGDVIEGLSPTLGTAQFSHHTISETVRALHLVTPKVLHEQFNRITYGVNKSISYFSPEVTFRTTVPQNILLEAVHDGDIVIVLDTNVLLHCATRNITPQSFVEEIRRVYPHLKNKPLKRMVVPFTVFQECRRNVLDRPSTRLSVRRLVWSRLINILRDTSVHSFSSEFPAIGFNLISSPLMQHSSNLRPLASGHGRKNPDENIINLCLWYQHAARTYHARTRSVAIGRMPSGAHFLAFQKMHLRRLLGHIQQQPGCDDLLLMTFDRELSYFADALGIDTYPRYINPSRCREVVSSESSDGAGRPDSAA